MNKPHSEFGAATRLPDDVYEVLGGGQEAQAYLNDKTLTLHFPKIFNNQDLTEIYDKIFMSFPTASALRTAKDKRIIQIPASDLANI